MLILYNRGNMLYKKLIAAALCGLTLAATALAGTSCSNSNPADITTAAGTQNPVTSIAPQSTADPGYIYGEQQTDYKGADFYILYPSGWSLYTDYYFAEQQTGDPVNDALYKRVTDTEDFFNINIQTVDCKTIDAVSTNIQKEDLAGAHNIDIALTHCISGLDTMVLKNQVYNWDNMPNVDFTKEYWNQSVKDYLDIGGYMPYVANDLIIPDPCFITFSKALLQQYSLEDPYQLVTSGQWTWDKLDEMAKQVSKDVDGDGKYTAADQYGFAGELDWMFINTMYSCGQSLLEKDASGRYALAINTQKTQNIVNSLNDLLYNGNQSFTWPYTATSTLNPPLPFDSGRALFYLNTGTNIKSLRATDFDFGILPYPKYDTNQANYVSLNWAGMICAPTDIADPGMVGAVTEYLGADSYQTVWPQYFNVLLNGKLARDDQSKAMLDLIYGNSIYDFGLNFDGFQNPELLYTIPKLLAAKSTDLASYYQQRAAAVQASYDKIYDAFIANANKT